MASVMSELSALHHPGAGSRPQAGAHGADASPDQGSFGALLDGVDDPTETATPASAPGQPTSPPAPSPNAAASPPSGGTAGAGAAGADAAKGATQPSPPADGAAAPKGGGGTEGAAGTNVKTIGKGGKPSTDPNMGTAQIHPSLPPGLAPPDPNAAKDASQSDPSVQGANLAIVADRRGEKADNAGKAEETDAAAAAAATAAPTGQSSNQTTPQPVAVALNVPSGATSADSSDADEISAVAALGNAGKAGRSGAPADPTGSAPADGGAAPSQPSGATPSEPSSVANGRAVGEAQSGPAQDGSNAGSLINADGKGAPQPPDAFARPPEWLEWGGRAREQGAVRPASESVAPQPNQGPNPPPSRAGDLSQPLGATGVQSHEAAPTVTGSDKASSAAPGGAADTPQQPISSASPDAPTSLSAPTNLAVPASGAGPVTATTPSAPPGAPAAAASNAAGTAIPIAGLAVEIAARAQQGTSRFEIRLDPPELGRIDVRLDVDHEGKVTSHVIVDRPATLDALRQEAPQLQRSLQEAGLKTAGDGLQFTLRDQGFANQNPYPRNAPLAGSQRVIVADSELPAVDAVRGRTSGVAGTSAGVDIRV